MVEIENEIIVPTARIHVLLAPKVNKALIIRRGPSKQVAFIGWNLKDNTFELRQWLKGKVYPYRSDLSSDGKHIIYFAMGKRSETYTAVSKFPYLKALDFYKKYDAWNGGGLFIDEKTYWLNEVRYKFAEKRISGLFKVKKKWNKQKTFMGECPAVYFKRLERDGWTLNEHNVYHRFYEVCEFNKSINNNTVLVKYFHMGINKEENKSPYHESHAIKYKGEIIEKYDDWDWADLIKSKIFYSKKGVIYSSYTKDGFLKDTLKIMDTNDMVFEEKIAPY